MTSDKTTISIIIPVYNAAAYIRDCVKSVLMQGRAASDSISAQDLSPSDGARSAEPDFDLELICVDDGSTDDSLSILRELAECDSRSHADSRIHVFTQANAGAPAARNHGFSHATGEYVMFLDSDDMLLPGAIAKLLAAKEQQAESPLAEATARQGSETASQGADIVIGDYREVDEQGRFLQDVPMDAFFAGLAADPETGRWKAALCPAFPGAKLFRRDFIEANGLRFADVRVGQDLNFYLKAVAAAQNIVFLPACTTEYRIVQGSISRKYDLRVLDIVRSMEDVRDFCSARGDEAMYHTYLSTAALIAYRSQMEKVPKMAEQDRAEAIRVLSEASRKVSLLKGAFKKKILKEKLKMLLMRIRYRQ